MLVGMLLEFLGLGIVFPLILSIVEPNELFDYKIIENLYSFLNLTSPAQMTSLFLVIILIVYFIKTIFMVYLTYKQNLIVADLVTVISSKLYEFYLNQPYNFHNIKNSSFLIKNIQVEVTYLSSFIMSIINISLDSLIIISLLISLLFIETKGAISIFFYLATIALIYYQLVKPLIKKWGEKRETIDKHKSKTLIEGLQSIKELILFEARNFFIKNFKDLNSQYASLISKNNTFQQIPRFYIEMSAILGIVFFLFIVIINNENPSNILAVLGVFVAAVFRILPSLNRVIFALQNLKFYTPSVDLIYNEISGAKFDKKVPAKEKLVSFQSEIKFKNVSFKYNSKQSWILEDINLTIKKGDFIGIVGVSGVGKSTVVDLLVGLYKPVKGKIFVDGINIFGNNCNNRNWIKKIGYVPQNILLVDDTILNNIAFGIKNNLIDKNQVQLAIENSGLSEFVNSLSEGLATNVGEKGLNLSGGQKQRLGIARALYKNPEIIIFDEATSALDEKTEHDIIKSITQFMGKKTIIMISHRSSTLKNCNKVYEINKRKISIAC